jgi:hypothetical protein
MTKKIEIGSKPTRRSSTTSNEWPGLEAAAKEMTAELTKRLTLDVPFSLHQRLKVKTTVEGSSISDVVRQLIVNYVDGEPTK